MCVCDICSFLLLIKTVLPPNTHAVAEHICSCSQSLQSLRVPTTGMAKGLGSRGGGATLQRSKLNQSQKQQQWEAKVDNSGGGGIGGKGIFNGGAAPAL